MYYDDNRVKCDTADETTNLAATIKDGLAPYTKNTASIQAVETGTVGMYNITVTTSKQWWLSYKLPEADSRVAQILANKAATEGLHASTAETGSVNTGTANKPVMTPTTNPYVAGGDTVYKRVR